MTDARDTFQPLESVILERHADGRAADIMERITRHIDFDIDKYLQEIKEAK